jgi:hypothetical protein
VPWGGVGAEAPQHAFKYAGRRCELVRPHRQETPHESLSQPRRAGAASRCRAGTRKSSPHAPHSALATDAGSSGINVAISIAASLLSLSGQGRVWGVILWKWRGQEGFLHGLEGGEPEAPVAAEGRWRGQARTGKEHRCRAGAWHHN